MPAGRGWATPLPPVGAWPSSSLTATLAKASGVTPEILLIHIMKTAGTSLRRMVIDGLGPEAVYPNDEDLDQRHRRWYPGNLELLEDVQAGRTHGARLLVGHVPYVLAEALDSRPLTVALLRDPLARSLSMLEHRRTRRGPFRGASYREMLADEGLVARQVRDYQTKIFAFDSLDECAENVNVPLEIDEGRFERAMARLEQVDVLGVVEDLPSFARRLERVAGIPVGDERRDNSGSSERPELDRDVLQRLEELTRRDRELYQRALELTGDRPGGSGPLRRLWPPQRWARRNAASRRTSAAGRR
jgi:hypothetical protein